MAWKYTSGLIFMAFLVIGLGFSGYSFFSAPSVSPKWQNLLNGQATSEYEDRFDENLPHRHMSIQSWNALGYVLFGEGKEGVLIGQDGWLFTNEEFIGGDNFQATINNNKKFILKTAESLKKENIALVIVPIPSKARLFQNKLGRYQFPTYWQAQYNNFLSFLDDNNIKAVNLLETFKKNTAQKIYLKTDTHWTPLGARISALKTGYFIADQFPYLTWETQQFVSKKTKEIQHEGDLMPYTVQGDVASKFDLQKDIFMGWQTNTIKSQSDNLFDDVYLPITLVGTSYSADDMWNFAGFLKESLQTDILNVSDKGLGPFDVMTNYLQSKAYENAKPKLLIWEIPERYLALPSDLKEQ